MGYHQRRRVAFGASIAAPIIGLALVAGCPTVDLGDTPADIGLCNPAKGRDYFDTTLYPMFVKRDGGTTSCVRSGCHDAGGGNALAFIDPPAQDSDKAANYRAAQVYLNCGTPNMSELLTKPLQGIDDPHGGGNIYTSMDDPAVQAFLDWFK